MWWVMDLEAVDERGQTQPCCLSPAGRGCGFAAWGRWCLGTAEGMIALASGHNFCSWHFTLSLCCARRTLKAALAPVEEELIETPPEQLLLVLQLLEQNG